jgi:hypothetical protein
MTGGDRLSHNNMSVRDVVEVSLARDYYAKVGKKLDYNETNKPNMIPEPQFSLLQNILTTEVSIYLLRRNIGFCGSLVDDMAGIRRGLINRYEAAYEEYIEYNNYY